MRNKENIVLSGRKGILVALLLIIAVTIIQFTSTGKYVLSHLSIDHAQILYKPFNRTNPYYDSWCRNATCYNSPTCAPCNRRFLFIIATGRSGSTTLLKMFNMLPNVRLSGENWNELYFASHLIKTLENHPDQFYDRDLIKNNGFFMHDAVPEGPFMHNAMPIGSIGCVMQSLVSFLNPPQMSPNQLVFDEKQESKMILGMKLIRLQQSKWTVNRARKFLERSFPCARYIINTRSEYSDQLKSMKVTGTFNENKTIDDIQSETLFLRKLANRLGDSAKLIELEQWRDNVSVLNDVIKWLGFDYCAFNKVLHENHDKFEHDNSDVHLGRYCRYKY